MPKTNNLLIGADFASIPGLVITRSGSMVDPNADLWDWTDGPFKGHINFGLYVGDQQRFVPSLKQSLVPFLKGSSSSHVQNLEAAFSHLLSMITPSGDISPQDIGSYAGLLKPNEKWRVGTLNVLIQRWVALGLPGIVPESAGFLSEHRKPGNRKGDAVRTRDPVSGPLSESEFTALYASVNAAYGRGELVLWALLLTRLLLACGGRPSQFASLKICDFDVSTGLLSLPQAKQRGAHTRTTFVEFDISPQTTQLIEVYVGELRGKGFVGESAFFPASVIMAQGPKKQMRQANELFYDHCEPNVLSEYFKAAVKPFAPLTERLNFAPLPITPQRFRYTFGTRLAEEGASKLVIANRLGHADLQNVDVYFSASPQVIENIDRTMGPFLAPLANAFQGRLVENEANSTQKGALGSRIIDFRVSSDPIGGCNQCARGCAFNKPVACYTCFRFEPFLDAPHEQVLDRLLKDRDKWEKDARMAAINDESIRAVETVIALCRQIAEQRKSETGATR